MRDVGAETTLWKAPVSRPQGLRVCCPAKPAWGVGHVLDDDGGARVTIIFPESQEHRVESGAGDTGEDEVVVNLSGAEA